ncbi:MAG: extracellular solute-binding protein, partial [Betaproteobacteria bacterium]
MSFPSSVARTDPRLDPGNARGWRFRCHAAPTVCRANGRMPMKRIFLAAFTLIAAALCPMSASAQNMTLDFPSWQAEDPGFAEWWKALIQDYEAKHPGVKIKLYSIPFVNYVNQLTVRFAGRNPPDIVHLPTRNFASFASQQWLEPIDDLIKTTDIPAKWSPLQSEMVWDGKTYGLL